jgi:hypothetical protein
MIIRTALPMDMSFMIEMDYEPCYDWDKIRPELVVKLMELRYPVGFMAYCFTKKVILLQKFAVRDDLLRTKIGTEGMHWLINRARQKELEAIQIILNEEFALSEDFYRCKFLKYCGFSAKLFRNKYVFTRYVQY